MFLVNRCGVFQNNYPNNLKVLNISLRRSTKWFYTSTYEISQVVDQHVTAFKQKGDRISAFFSPHGKRIYST